jgi:Mlc titration factor MtfA (ptsG expression regulator)
MLAEFLQNYSRDLLLLLILLLALGLIFLPAWQLRQRRAALRQQAFPKAWRKVLQQHWPMYRALPADLQQELRRQIQRFIAEVKFVGCDGITVTDAMRVLIAAQACLLTLKLPVNDYPGLRQILVYPDAFGVAITTPDQTGVVHSNKEWREGESWQQGQVILSWRHTLAGAAVADDGRNLVVHEFAHQLDQQTGSVNGFPPLPSIPLQRDWSLYMQQAFDELQRDVTLGAPLWIDRYAATNPAEFFAVLTELFFEMPHYVAERQPRLYHLMQQFFQLDPQSWPLQQAQLPSRIQNRFS